ncbi:MAG: hypothetical protein PHQ54_00210, partial [Candidatus Omnitrophica bacterium]|nr:hypothetical protein [Candidatus Omnitrophota bacterium]
LVIGYSGGIAKAIYDSGGISEDILKHFNQYLDESSGRLTDDLFSDFLNLCPKKPKEEWSLLTLKITV